MPMEFQEMKPSRTHSFMWQLCRTFKIHVILIGVWNLTAGMD